MCVAWIQYEIERGPSDSPTKGTSDDPSAAYSHPRFPGRGNHRSVLPYRRRLRLPQPKRAWLPFAQEALRLGGAYPGALAALARCGERTLVLARRPEILFAPVPRSGGAASFLVASKGEKAQALPGAVAPRGPFRDGRRPGDVACGLDAAFGFAPQAGLSGLGFPRRRVGTLGFLQRLWGEAAPRLCHQWGSSLLRAYRRKHRRRPIGRRTHQRGEAGRGGGSQTLGRPGLPQQGTEGGFGRGRHPPEYPTIRAAAWAQAANRDLLFELEEGLWSRGDAGHHPGRAGHQDCGEDLRLHLRLVG